LAAVFVMGWACWPAVAQEGKVTEFSLHAGILPIILGGDETYILLTFGGRLDAHLGKSFSLSTELALWTTGTFSGFAVVPSVLANYVTGPFSLGAGVMIGVYGEGGVLPKFNIGYRSGHLALNVYTLTNFKDALFGGSLGYVF
jgi:hypothetical protein